MTNPAGEGAPRDLHGSLRVRASRDGDRFHYIWAATQLLRLLDPHSKLQQVAVEGVGDPAGSAEPKGSEVIDLVEFYGNDTSDITKLVIRQFKHSTLASDRKMGIAEVGDILAKFALLDDEGGVLRTRHASVEMEFSIVTNRPIAAVVESAMRALASGASNSESSSAAKLRARMGIDPQVAESLCRRTVVTGNVESVSVLRPRLTETTRGYTADTDVRIAAQLIELIAQRASTEASGPVRLADVVAAFGTQPDELRPAPSLLENLSFSHRAAYDRLASDVIASTLPVILTAEGGAGKSTFARAAADLLLGTAEVFVYDCFGRGSYRRPDRLRHRHKDGLVQIATDLASAGLCLPILPMPGVANADYVKAFVRRLEVASETLAARNAKDLVLIIDAADNAEIAASEYADGRSFVRDLLRLGDAVPPNVHIVFTCRPERLELLDPPGEVSHLSLDVFAAEEASEIVRGVYPDALDREVSEIHARTAGNPRVLALAMEDASTIRVCLDRLAGLARYADAPLDVLLGRRVDAILADAGRGQTRLGHAAQLLTLLRPSIPVETLAALSGVTPAGIRSFVSDLGRGLVMTEGSVQFLDEPTETFFRTHHAPSSETALQAVRTLRDLSATSSYAASSLPEVMWSAELYDDLLALAAGDDALPGSSEVERRQIEHLRIDFGLRAAVSLRRPASVVQLALRAGATRAGTARRLQLLLDHPDFAGETLDARSLEALIASRAMPCFMARRNTRVRGAHARDGGRAHRLCEQSCSPCGRCDRGVGTDSPFGPRP